MKPSASPLSLALPSSSSSSVAPITMHLSLPQTTTTSTTTISTNTTMPTSTFKSSRPSSYSSTSSSSSSPPYSRRNSTSSLNPTTNSSLFRHESQLARVERDILQNPHHQPSLLTLEMLSDAYATRVIGHRQDNLHRALLSLRLAIRLARNESRDAARLSIKLGRLIFDMSSISTIKNDSDNEDSIRSALALVDTGLDAYTKRPEWCDRPRDARAYVSGFVSRGLLFDALAKGVKRNRKKEAKRKAKLQRLNLGTALDERKKKDFHIVQKSVHPNTMKQQRQHGAVESLHSKKKRDGVAGIPAVSSLNINMNNKTNKDFYFRSTNSIPTSTNHNNSNNIYGRNQKRKPKSTNTSALDKTTCNTVDQAVYDDDGVININAVSTPTSVLPASSYYDDDAQSNNNSNTNDSEDFDSLDDDMVRGETDRLKRRTFLAECIRSLELALSAGTDMVSAPRAPPPSPSTSSLSLSLALPSSSPTLTPSSSFNGLNGSGSMTGPLDEAGVIARCRVAVENVERVRAAVALARAYWALGSGDEDDEDDGDDGDDHDDDKKVDNYDDHDIDDDEENRHYHNMKRQRLKGALNNMRTTGSSSFTSSTMSSTLSESEKREREVHVQKARHTVASVMDMAWCVRVCGDLPGHNAKHGCGSGEGSGNGQVYVGMDCNEVERLRAELRQLGEKVKETSSATASRCVIS